ncbi:MAG: polysaccharide deacetylase family protein [bacterium]|nr:polysaccharide deacetylase family protein [bacterium]
MFDRKKKMLTFSYDDGVKQDVRLIELFDKYGLKATFNLNSERTHLENMVSSEEIAKVYKNHEVAVHTLTHPYLNKIDSDEEIIREVEQDRINLEKIVGYKVSGMAYPYGNGAIDDRVVELVRNHTGIKYSRTTESSYNFELQDDLLMFKPTIHHAEFDKLMDLGRRFVELNPDTPKLFYVWGHSYEFDYDDGIYWDKMEEFCKLVSGHSDIFYGTNAQVLLSQGK